MPQASAAEVPTSSTPHLQGEVSVTRSAPGSWRSKHVPDTKGETVSE